MGGPDETLSDWVTAKGRSLFVHEVVREAVCVWSKSRGAQRRVEGHFHEIAIAHGVKIGSLPLVTSGVGVIDLDENRF